MPEEVAKALVKQGAPLDAGDSKGNTALHYSLEMDDLQVSFQHSSYPSICCLAFIS
jgi:ankyrin repeat protein